MDKRGIILLIIASAISLLSLVGIQSYWVNISLEKQQINFDQTVMEVMAKVIQKLEKEEAITQITSKLFRDSEFQNGLNGDSTVSIEQFSFNDAFSNNSITKEHSTDPSEKDQLRINFTPAKALDSSIFIIRKTQKRVLGSNLNYSPVSDDSNALKSQLKRKATLVNDIVNELALISISKDFNERIEVSKIDSILAMELIANGIHLDYLFDVFDSETQELSFLSSNEYASQIKESPYKLSLFPNDFYLESDYLLLFFPEQNRFILKSAWQILLVSLLIVLLLTFLLYSSISTIFKQKKLSQVKNDFINNMTHELKTPISTISLACEALKDESLDLDSESRDAFTKMIQEENNRLSLLVDNVLKSAVWDSVELELTKKPENLSVLIEEISSRFKIQLKNSRGSIELDLNAKNSIVSVDKIHFTNLYYNLLDNANKYGGTPPKIKVESKNENGFFCLSIADNGIGISKSDQKKIFDKFYRVPTGNIHDVKGFGLGLNYVKRIVELHAGQITIESKVGEGTTIIIKLKIHE